MFKKLRNKVVAKLRHNKKAFFARIQPHSQKEFWKLFKFLNPKGNTMPTLVTATTTATSNLDKANLLNSTFMKNFNYSVLVYKLMTASILFLILALLTCYAQRMKCMTCCLLLM